jgi:hypothetical protein
VCCLAKWSDPDRGGYGKHRETQVVWSFQFSIRSDVGLLRGGVLLLVHVVVLLRGGAALLRGVVLLLVHVVALLRGGVALLRGVVLLPEAVFAVSQVLMASSKKI